MRRLSVQSEDLRNLHKDVREVLEVHRGSGQAPGFQDRNKPDQEMADMHKSIAESLQAACQDIMQKHMEQYCQRVQRHSSQKDLASPSRQGKATDNEHTDDEVSLLDYCMIAETMQPAHVSAASAMPSRKASAMEHSRERVVREYCDLPCGLICISTKCVAKHYPLKFDHMSDAAMDGLAKCQAALSGLAPRLAPNCTAASSVSFEGVADVLQKIYVNEGVRPGLKQMVESATTCPYCGRKAEYIDLEWHVDVAKRRTWPKSCTVICKYCADVRDLPSLVKRLCFEKESAFSSRTLRHFLEVNNLDAAKSHLFQDAISVAHAMLALQKGLKLTPSRGPPLQELLNMNSVASPQSQEKTRKIKTKKAGQKKGALKRTDCRAARVSRPGGEGLSWPTSSSPKREAPCRTVEDASASVHGCSDVLLQLPHAATEALESHLDELTMRTAARRITLNAAGHLFVEGAQASEQGVKQIVQEILQGPEEKALLNTPRPVTAVKKRRRRRRHHDQAEESPPSPPPAPPSPVAGEALEVRVFVEMPDEARGHAPGEFATILGEMMPRIQRASLAVRPEVLRSLALVAICAAWDRRSEVTVGRQLGSSTDQAAVGRLRIARRIKTYDAFENMGEPIDVYSTFFGVSVLMLVVLFVIPFATKFGRSEEEAEDEEAELLYEEVEDDEEDLFEPEEAEASQEEGTDDKVVAKAEKASVGSVSEHAGPGHDAYSGKNFGNALVSIFTV
ncbi:unnamed protein product [Symbiodinium microadriaticum]|nr:unnamed protein product [Symbiodinium microadriaticum]